MNLWIGLSLAAGIALAGKPAQAPKQEKKKMETSAFKTDLPDAGYWADPLANADEVTGQFDMVFEHATGIGAPKEIDLGSRKTFPLAIYEHGTPKDRYHYDLNSSAWVVVMDVFRNDIRFNVAVPMEDNQTPPEPTDNTSSAITSKDVIDLAERVELPMRPGTYIAQIINRDHVSNRATTVIKGSVSPFPDPEVAKFIAEEAHKREIPPVWPALIPRGHAPTFVKQAGSPNPPEGSGIALNAKRVQMAGRDSACLLQGSFRLPANFGRYIPLDKRSADKTKPIETVRMPVHILVTGSESPLAFTARMMIPAYDAVKDPKDAAPVTGYFNFDLLDYADLRKKPQTYFIYLFSGDAMFGPLPMALVDPGEIR